MLTVAGLHTPLMPSTETGGRSGAVLPAQMVNVSPKSKSGTMLGVTVTVNVVGTAHWPAAGVNVYTPDAWLSTTVGSQVPVTLLAELTGRAGGASPEQMVNEVPKSNAGVTIVLTVTESSVVNAHCPAVGVKV